MKYEQPTSSVPSYNPAWMAYISPYSFIYRNKNSGLGISLDDINNNSYDGNKLGEIVAKIPIDSSMGISALISYDGAIAVPQCDDFPTKSDGIEKLNEIQCSLLLGGIHTEVLHSNALSIGFLQDKVRLFSYTPSIHTQLRLNWSSVSERKNLLNPRVLFVEDIKKAFCQGQKIIKGIYNFSPFFLLNAYTALIHRNNSDALNNLWIVVEQLTDFLWKEQYLKMNAWSPRLQRCHSHLSQKRQLKNIWAKQQMLRLSKIITKKCHKTLSTARTTRNDLVHDGTVPDFCMIKALWDVLPSLFEACSSIHNIGINNICCYGDGNWDIPKKTNFDDWSELSIKLNDVE
ncbi:hypothetical protein [Salinivibrio sp. VYel4]|uniref:hypothetical protein n=1 Tax=Salinivibrio sp. VYel4 TaxID=2490491 RepID=UPI00128DAA09|nr:hypothetical protein [Salinivibrio sp. VYel4]MPY01332.1 hypothetical protein [Salinivibrio sp. VYel4]